VTQCDVDFIELVGVYSTKVSYVILWFSFSNFLALQKVCNAI